MNLIKAYVRYLKDNPEGYWFRAKVYGWGWTPARWQGWVTLAVFVALLVLNFLRIDGGSHSASDTLRPFVLQAIVLTGLLLIVCWKTGEKPRWMWGLPEKYK